MQEASRLCALTATRSRLQTHPAQAKDNQPHRPTTHNPGLGLIREVGDPRVIRPLLASEGPMVTRLRLASPGASRGEA
jgi:hypothetical protein